MWIQQKLDDVKAPTLVATIVARTTAPTLPETTRYLKLLDIRPLELARQLTVVESQMYQVIKPVDLFLRSQGENVEHEDSITVITRFSDRVGLHTSFSDHNYLRASEDSTLGSACCTVRRKTSSASHNNKIFYPCSGS